MIFNSIKDIKKDIYDRILSHLQDSDNIDAKHISSLLKTYLYELQIKDEIDGYQTTANRNDDSLFVEISKNNKINSFVININTELRKLKIKKINNNTSYIFN